MTDSLGAVRQRLPHLSRSLIDRRGIEIALRVLVAAALQFAAAVGLAYVAGFSRVATLFDHFRYFWLLVLFGSLVVSFTGYYYCYKGLYRVEGGPGMSARELRAVVIAGFGGFLAHGGGALDAYALRAAGTDERDANVRVSALAGLEHGVLAIGGCGAAIVVLLAGYGTPPADFSLPWAIIPIPGFLVAFWAAEKYRSGLREAGGWRGKLGIFLDAIHLTRVLFRHPFRDGPAVPGMALFWLTDIFAGWAALAAWGFHMNGAEFVVGFATGMVFTRRTGPFAGAGVLVLVLPVTLWVSGAPLAVAVVGMLAYRFLSLWLPMPFALAALPTLRAMGKGETQQSEGTHDQPEEPALEAG